MTPITALPTELAAMREVVETLAPIERAAGEPGEHKWADVTSFGWRAASQSATWSA